MKTVCVVRYGAFGDMIMITPALRQLKQDGYRVVVNCHKRSAAILENNPHVDEVLIHDESIPNEKLESHWTELAKNYDKFINLSGSIETGLLPAEGKDAAYSWPHEIRHRDLNVNYYDRTLELCGYPEVRGLNGEIFFSPAEREFAQQLKTQYKDRFWILWSLSGSAMHKVYPYAEEVAVTFLERHPDAMTMTVGDELCRLLEWDHPRNKKRCGAWDKQFRKVMVAASVADVVVSPETGVANAAGCFPTPKIIMLSHSSRENLTKYWENCVNLTPENAACHPCHQLHYTLRSCPLDTIAAIPEGMKNKGLHTDEDVVAPICTSRISPAKFLDALEAQYLNWKEQRNDQSKRSFHHEVGAR